MEFETLLHLCNGNVFTTVIAVSILYIFVKFVLTPRQALGRHVQDTKSCSSPTCVRCSVYSIVLKKSEEEFRKYISEHSDTGLERLLKHYRKAPEKTSLQQPNVLHLQYLLSRPFWSQEDSPILQEATHCLLQQHTAILKEYGNLSKEMNASHGWKTNVTETGHWNTFYLYNQGIKNSENCLKCPAVTDILEKSLDSVFMKGCVFGNAFFSHLLPGTTISEHYGPCNVRIRIHLGVSVTPGWILTVNERTESWVSGQCLMFDDSFLHSVHYNTQDPPTQARTVLIIDIWHPQLTPKERAAITAVYNVGNC